MSELSRRSLVATAAALPAAVAAAAMPAPALANGSTTLPPELIERFVRVRARKLEMQKQFTLWCDEVDRRLYAATGVTKAEWRDFNQQDPRWKELLSVRDAISNDVPYYESEAEGDERHAECWRVVEAMMDHEPHTLVDFAWQAEALLIGNPDVLPEDSSYTSDRLIRTFFQRLRTVAVIPPELSSSAVRS